MLEIILYSLLIMTSSLVGVFSVWKNFGSIMEKNLHYLVSFSAGIFLVIAYNLIIETTHYTEKLQYSVFWILVGVVLIWTIFKFLPQFHQHDQIEKDKEHRLDPRKIVFSDAIHNIGDGILLATSFVVSSTFGVLTALSIFIHELIQEISEFFILRESGYSTKKSLKINFAASSTILIGSIGSYFLLETFEIIELPLLGIAAGTFLVVVLQDLIPHSLKHSISTKHFFKHLVWFAIGILIMFLISSNLEHTHEHEEGRDEIHDSEHVE